MAARGTGRNRGGGKRRASPRTYGLVVAALLVIVAGLFLVLWRLGEKRERLPGGEPPPPPEAQALPPTRSVLLYFGGEDGEGVVAELREVRATEGVEAEARALLQELLRGPLQGATRTIPSGTRLLKVFFDRSAARLYLDFSRELRTNHWGGSAGELLTIRSLVGTVASNLPAVKSVQLLVEGEEVESIAGHVDCRSPFPVANWREELGEETEARSEEAPSGEEAVP